MSSKRALISHPFRLLGNGSIATRDEVSDAYLAERVALTLAVRPRERPLVPAFGVKDAAFEGLPIAALQTQMDVFGIPVLIVDVQVRIISDSKTEYLVQFQKKGVDQ